MSSKEIAEQRTDELLMTEKRRYPEVFKWKIATIIIVVLIAIAIVINLIMLLYLKNHELRNNNYTFAADLVNLLSGTNITRSQFVNLMGGLTISYGDIWFQKTSKVASWSSTLGTMLNLQQAASFFSTKVTDRLTLVRFTDGVSVSLIGAYTHIPFQLPKDDWNTFLSNETNSYYTFQIDEKQSTMIGSNSQSFLKMNETADNLANCRIINLNQYNLTFLLGADIILNSKTNPNQAQLRFLSEGQLPATCFFNGPNYETTMKQIIAPFELGPTYEIIDINTYSLTT